MRERTAVAIRRGKVTDPKSALQVLAEMERREDRIEEQIRIKKKELDHLNQQLIYCREEIRTMWKKWRDGQ